MAWLWRTEMDGDATRLMPADEFLEMALEQDLRAELHDGMVVAMSPARVAHARALNTVHRLIEREIDARALPCEAFAGSVALKASERSLYVPDLILRCGAPLDGAVASVEDGTFFVEVVSERTARSDTGRKLAAYSRLPSFSAYLLVYPEDRRAVLHSRGPEGALVSRLVAPTDDAPLVIDPPGLTLDPAALLGWR